MNAKLLLCLALILIGGSLLAGLQISMADEDSASQKNQNSQNDTEIRREIVGTWVACGSFTYTNNLVSFSETLTYAKNGCYSATETIVSDGKTRVEKCQGLWFLQDGILKYSITNAIGVKPDSEPFFYSKARVIRVNKKQLFLLEGTDRPAFFERRFNCRSTLNPTVGATAAFVGICNRATVKNLIANKTSAPEDFARMSRDAEIRQKIPGTWIRGGVTFTNDLGAFSETEMLTFTTNGCYSATKTTISAGRTRVQKCQGLWSVHDRTLIYSITNCIGVSMTNCIGPEASEPFFYPRAKVVRVNEKQLVLLEWMDQISFFERDTIANKH